MVIYIFDSMKMYKSDWVLRTLFLTPTLLSGEIHIDLIILEIGPS